MTEARRILVVEDDPDGQTVVAHVLGYMNIPTDIADSGERACELLFDVSKHYTAVVIDLALPQMNGWNLLQAIRQNPHTANYTCIAITAYHSSSVRERALEAGFTSYFPKPIDATSFVRALEQVVKD